MQQVVNDDFVNYWVLVLRVNFDNGISDEIFSIEIIGVKAAEILEFSKSARAKAADGVIPDFPQLESKLVYSTQRPPVADKLLGRFDVALEATRVEFNHQLFDVVQTSGTGDNGVERAPFRTLDVDLQNVNRCLRNSKVSHNDVRTRNNEDLRKCSKIFGNRPTHMKMHAGRVACCPLVSHAEYAPRALY